MSSSQIAIIVEGVKTEPKIFNSLKRLFFSGSGGTENISLEIIQFPFCGNIYQFYELLRADGLTDEGSFELPVDTIPLLQDRVKNLWKNGQREGLLPRFDQKDVDRLLRYKRTDFSQIFLFFDAELQDPHDKKDEIIRLLTTVFSDETGNGKLYINYPMVEALKDIRKGVPCCQDCLLSMSDISGYKMIVGKRSGFTNVENYKVGTWQLFCKRAVQRVSCLLLKDTPVCGDSKSISSISFQDYRKKVIQQSLYILQYDKYISVNSEVMVLSSIPLFLLDYYREPIWKKMVEW